MGAFLDFLSMLVGFITGPAATMVATLALAILFIRFLFFDRSAPGAVVWVAIGAIGLLSVNAVVSVFF